MSNKQAKPAKTKNSILNAKWFPYALLSLIWLIVYAVTYDSKIDLGGDNAAYYILGDAISSGEGYTNVHVVGERPNNHFPPGYPAILAFFMLFTHSVSFLKIVSGLFFLGTVLLSYRIFNYITERVKLSLVLSIFLILNGNLIQSGNIMMSEIPFLFFATLTLLYFIQSESREDFWKDWHFWAMVAVGAFSFHIRTAGIALIAALGIYLLFNRKWKKLVVFAGSFVALCIPWILRGRSIGGNSYINQLLQVNPYRKEDGLIELSDLFTRLGYNIERYISVELPKSFLFDLQVNYSYYMRWLTGDETLQNYTVENFWAIGIILLALIVYGVYHLKHYRSFVAIYLLGSAAILLLWPYVWFGTRFILPLIPFLLLGAVNGVDALLSKVSKSEHPNEWFYLAGCLLLFGGVKQESEKKDLDHPNKYNNFLKMSDYVGDNLPADAVVLNRKPGLFYLYGHRKSINVPSTLDYGEMEARLDSTGVTHVIIDAMGFADVSRYLVPFIQDNPEKFKPIHQITSPDAYPTTLIEYYANRGYTGEWETITNGDKQIKQRTGKGLFRFTDGRIFDGYWKKGLRDGEGVMTFPSGAKLSGTWTNDTINGDLVLLSANADTLLFGDYSEEEAVQYLKKAN